jgi:hypothetical protein
MNSKLQAHALLAILLACVSFVSVVSANGDPIVRNTGAITYVSGGVGTESAERLNALAGDFNLKLVFALKAGDYVSGVRVVIADGTGKTLLDSTSEGPWFLIKLPVGDYQVKATFAGNAVTRQVVVGTARLQTIDFRWASDIGKD